MLTLVRVYVCLHGWGYILVGESRCDLRGKCGVQRTFLTQHPNAVIMSLQNCPTAPLKYSLKCVFPCGPAAAADAA